jgi:phosphoribosylaminoimidazole-succinocarboxamide synthase
LGKDADLIPDKGAALCVMGAYCFERLEEPTNVMKIGIVGVIHPRPVRIEGVL